MGCSSVNPEQFCGDLRALPPAGSVSPGTFTIYCMTRRPLLPLADYQRIYQVIYSVLETTRIATTHRACPFFATAGVTILQKHYGLPATLSVGALALMVDEKRANVVVFGRQENGEWVHDSKGFHAWVECNGWLVDFMAPIMGVALKEDGVGFDVPRNMLQKPLADRKDDPREIQHVGEFYCHSDKALAEALIDSQPAEFMDLLHVCETWFRKPPKALLPIALGGTDVQAPKPLVLRAPAIGGVW